MAITIELNEITRDYLDEMSIHDIRTYAREVGVPAPTSMRKQEMIDYIIDIRDGKASPQKARKAGRPPKAAPENVAAVTPVRAEEAEAAPQSTRESAPTERSSARNGNGYRVYTPQPQKRTFEQRRRLTNEWRDNDQAPDKNAVYFTRPNDLSRTPNLDTFEEDDRNNLLDCEVRSGILEVLPDGYGFLRAANFRNSSKDSYKYCNWWI